MMSKSRVGFWLLIALIPAGFTAVVALPIAAFTETENPGAWTTLFFIFFFYIILGLPTGLVLRIWGSVETKSRFRAAQRYAELHGWHPISQTAWRNMKQGGANLAVQQAFQKQTFILTLTVGGETHTVDEFESSLWALQFGDWLWSELSDRVVTAAVVQEKRQEWDQTHAIVLRQ